MKRCGFTADIVQDLLLIRGEQVLIKIPRITIKCMRMLRSRGFQASLKSITFAQINDAGRYLYIYCSSCLY